MENKKRERAIELRRLGKTYSEILSEVFVAKSTLSEWFKSVHLSQPQIQRITQKRIDARLRGAKSKKNKRLAEITRLSDEGKISVGILSRRELWLIGTALYWAEGSKQNTRSPSAGMIFGNSDYRMIAVFLTWLKQAGVSTENIDFELYVHVNRKEDAPEFKKWWAEKLGISMMRIQKMYLKPGNPKTRRSNVGDLYHGLLRIRVRSSTILNRRVQGWTDGIVAAMGNGVIGNTSAFEAEESRIVP